MVIVSVGEEMEKVAEHIYSSVITSKVSWVFFFSKAYK